VLAHDALFFETRKDLTLLRLPVSGGKPQRWLDDTWPVTGAGDVVVAQLGTSYVGISATPKR
jgi:hypothetical protein